MFTSVTSRAAATYKRVNADTGVSAADPHHLVSMLFDGLIQSLNAARGAMERGEIDAKGVAIGKSVRILEEGLRSGLNMAQGGDLAQNLNNLYGYAAQRLSLANVRNDGAIVTEVLNLIQPLADSWKQIRAVAATSKTAQGV